VRHAPVPRPPHLSQLFSTRCPLAVHGAAVSKGCQMNGAVLEEREVSEGALTSEDFRRDVLAGLSRAEKSLPCKYFYDEAGAHLFEAICELEEYYPTRTETAILRHNLEEIVSLLG